MSQENKSDKWCESCCGGGCVKSYAHYDRIAMASTILSFLAFAVSWVFFGTFIISLIAFVLQMNLWFRRTKPAEIMTIIAFTGLAALLEIGTGIYVSVLWNSRSDRVVDKCEPFTFSSDHYRGPDLCDEKLYAIICYIAGALWFAAFGCLAYFYKSGRYAKLEEEFEKGAVGVDNDEEQALPAEAEPAEAEPAQADP